MWTESLSLSVSLCARATSDDTLHTAPRAAALAACESVYACICTRLSRALTTHTHIDIIVQFI